MSFTDTQQAKKFASIAEVAAAQAKLNAEKLEGAPDYAAQAQESAIQASTSSQEARNAVSEVNALSVSASQSATSAAQSASEAESAASGAIGRSVRAPIGESLQELPNASSRLDSVSIFNGQGDVDVKPLSDFAIIDESGKIPVSMIPSIALTQPFVVSSEAAMLVLNAQVGDIAKRTDLGYSFCLASAPASSLSNWVQLTDDVLSQLGQASGASSVGATDPNGSPSTVQAQLLLKAEKEETLSQISGLQDQIDKSIKVTGVVNFYQFGAVGDGVADDTQAVASAFSYAATNKMKVVQRDGVFLLTGSTYINITGLDADLTGCVLKPSSTWTGQIVITQPEAPVTYGSTSSVVSAINSSSSSSRQAGSNLLDGLSSNTDLDGCFVQISTSQPMFVFRDTTYTRMDLNRVYNRGNLENSLRYPLGTNVTSIKSLKIRSFVQTVRGLTIDESLTTRYGIVRVNQATRVNIDNISFINRPITQAFSDTRLGIYESYDVKINGLFAPSVSDSMTASGDIYSYTLGFESSLNIEVNNATANGEGWGATGSNNCANIKFENCDLSRVDFHMPFQNYLKVNNCNIGRHGVLVTGTGDLHITNSTFNASPDSIGNIVATRADAGGWFDGDLYMDNITLTGRRSAGTQGVAFINGSSSAGQGPASGSPIRSTLFNRIVIRDVKLKDGALENMFGTFISSNNDNILLFPSLIDVDGFCFSILPKSSGVGFDINFSRFKSLYSDMTNSESSVTGRFTTDIILRNVKSPYVSITSASGRHNPRVVLDSCRHTLAGDGAMTFSTNQRGNYELNNCVIDNIKLISGSSPNAAVYLKVNGGKIIQPSGGTLPLTVPDDSHFIELNYLCIVAQFSAQDTSFPITRNLIRYSLMNGCDYWDLASGLKLFSLQYLSSSSTSLTTTIPIRVGQIFTVTSGYTGTNTYTKSFFTAMDSSQTKQVAAIAAGNIIVTYTVSGNIVSSMTITSPTSNEVVSIGVK